MAEVAAGIGAGVAYLATAAGAVTAGSAAAATVAAVATAVVEGIAIGAVLGAGMAAIKGTDILQGALSGAAIGGVTAGIFSAASAGVSAFVSETADVSIDAGVEAGVDLGTGEVAQGVAEGAGTGEVGGSFLDSIKAAAGPNLPGASSPTEGLMSSVGDLSDKSVRVVGGVPQTGSGLAANLARDVVNKGVGEELTPTQKFEKQIAEDKKTAMYGNLGSGLFQGVGQVGSEMMKESAAKDASKQAIQDATDLQHRNYSSVPYALGGSPVSMTVNPQAAYQSNVTANAPNTNVAQNLGYQTSNQNVSGLLASQTSNISAPISDWWSSHLQAVVPTPKAVTA